MQRKILSLFIVVALILFGISVTFWLRLNQNIEKKVLNELQKELEFCKIVKKETSALRGKFWMICNGRPFFAEYENGKLKYELNGWGFLKEQPEILDELEKEGCNFYNFSENILTFICKSRKTKFYEFSNFKLKRINEDLTINTFSRLINSKYPCVVIGEEVFEKDGNTFFRLICNCDGKETIFNFNFEKRYLSLPIVVEKEIPNKEKVEFSYQLLNICRINYNQEIGLTRALLGLDCNLGTPTINYDFEFAMANFLIKDAEFEALFPYLGKYNLQDMAGMKLEYLKKEEKENVILRYYLAGERVIVAKEEKGSGLISEIYFKNEGL